MKIRSIETFTRDHVSVVRVHTDDGGEGYGQIAPYHADISAIVLHRQIAPRLLNRDIGRMDTLATRLVEAEYKFPGSYVCRAAGGLETALWDLTAKQKGVSVCELFNGKPVPLAPYGSSMRRDIKPDDEAARLVRLRDEHGYRAFKIRIGSVCGHDADEWTGRTEELVPTVRKALGSDITILVDGNSCYTPKRAIEVGRMLEQNGVGHFEEPCPYWELEWTAEVAAALEVPVAGGEQDTDLAQFQRMVSMKAVDIVQPDVCYLGGLSRTLAVGRMAEAAGIPCLPHSANRSMVTVFTLHAMTVMPAAARYVEFSIEPDRWADEIFDPPLVVRDGFIPFPSGPGWGVVIRKAWLEGADRQVSEA